MFEFDIEKGTETETETEKTIHLKVTKIIDGVLRKSTAQTFKFDHYSSLLFFLTGYLDYITEEVKYEIY
jgi:hypothetical protein